MRRQYGADATVVMFNRVTTDGFFAAPDVNLDWGMKEREGAVASWRSDRWI